MCIVPGILSFTFSIKHVEVLETYLNDRYVGLGKVMFLDAGFMKPLRGPKVQKPFFNVLST